MNISVEKVKAIGEEIGATHLILFARAADGEENVSTHGLTEQQAHEAAHTGNRLKKILGWPDELCQATIKPRRLLEFTLSVDKKEADHLGDFLLREAGHSGPTSDPDVGVVAGSYEVRVEQPQDMFWLGADWERYRSQGYSFNKNQLTPLADSALEELERLLPLATRAPWAVNTDPKKWVTNEGTSHEQWRANRDNDAAVVAALRNSALGLVARVRAAEALQTKLVAVLTEHRDAAHARFLADLEENGADGGPLAGAEAGDEISKIAQALGLTLPEGGQENA